MSLACDYLLAFLSAFFCNQVTTLACLPKIYPPTKTPCSHSLNCFAFSFVFAFAYVSFRFAASPCFALSVSVPTGNTDTNAFARSSRALEAYQSLPRLRPSFFSLPLFFLSFRESYSRVSPRRARTFPLFESPTFLLLTFSPSSCSSVLSLSFFLLLSRSFLLPLFSRTPFAKLPRC